MTTTTSRKALKGTVAAAAGAAILLGGLGTFASWSINGDLGAGELQTGRFELATDGHTPGAWLDVNGGEEIDAAAFRLVPGDVLERTDTFAVIAYGTNLDVDANVTGAPAVDGITVDVAHGFDDLDITNQEPQDIAVTVRVTVADDAPMGQSIDLSDIGVTLTHSAATQA